MTPEFRDVPELLTSRREVFTGRLLHVFRDEVDLGDGRPGIREVIHHPGAAAVVAITDDDRAVLVRQWRHAVGRAMWELCAGTRDGDEDFAVCARRELTEETGYSANVWHKLGVGAVSPGYSDESIHIYLARELTAGASAQDDDENVATALFSRADVLELVGTGATDLKTIAGLALAGWLSVSEHR
jgi:ADP-ribose pyrophosphatase